MATKFITVSIEIMHDKNLNSTQKFILAEIEQLSSLKNGCIATNKHFSKLIGISTSGVSRAISALQNSGYIDIDNSESIRNNGRIITLKEGIDSSQEGIDSSQEGIDSSQESKENITNNITNNITVSQRAPVFRELNGHQKIQYLQSILNKHIGTQKIKIFREDLLSAKELVEQIEDHEDFINAYLEHKKSLDDKKYLKGMFAFISGYVDGTLKSAKGIEDDYVVEIYDCWTKLEDGNFACGDSNNVINPFTGEIIPGYWDKRGCQ